MYLRAGVLGLGFAWWKEEKMRSNGINIPEKKIIFGKHEVDVSDPSLDDKPISGAYRDLCYEFAQNTANSCEFYRERLADAGLQPNEISSQDSFEAIPPLSSGEVSTINDAMLLPDRIRESLKSGFYGHPVAEKLWRKFSTSGSSTLRPKVSYYTKHDWEVSATTAARLVSRLSLNNVSRIFNCFHGGHIGAKFLEDGLSTLGCSVEGVHISRTTPDAVLNQLMTSGASELGGFNALAIPPGLAKGIAGANKGTNLDSLLDLDVENFIGRNIRVIITSGAPRDAPGLNLKKRVWEGNELAGVEKTKFYEMYGFTESLPAAMECEESAGLHLAIGPTYTEVLDEKTGRHVADGERGLVAITGLRQGSRFLRYLVGDEATYISEPCRCGRTSHRLQNIERVTDIERLQQGCGGGV